MKPARIAVLGIALASGGAAIMLMNNNTPPPPKPAQIIEKAVPANTVDVLVAAIDINTGQVLKPADMRWQQWPADNVVQGYLKRTELPGAIAETSGSIARGSFLAGEPIRREKLVRADGSGFMSAILPAGMRAVAISIDRSGTNYAGGFVLPNDRVDILRTYRNEEAGRGGEAYISEIILTNIRVLAIGQNIQERNGERVVVGENATLELTPTQAVLITLAQRVGQLSLVLRSLADSKTNERDQPVEKRDEGSLSIVRYGVQSSVSAR